MKLKSILPIIELSLGLNASQNSINGNNEKEEKQEEVATEVTPIELFNGQDIDDWVIKIRGHEVGENYGNTFRVEDGLMKVRYDEYDEFNQQYGHIAYKDPFGYYILRV